MTNTLTRSPTTLRDVLYELSLAKDVPDAELLDEFVQRYPEHAVVLTDFAVALVVDALRRDEVAATLDTAKVSPAVSRAMSKFLNKLHAVQSLEAPAAVERPTRRATVENPFAALDRAAFRALAKRLNASTVFFCKLRDRQIELQTMTSGFLERVADEMKIALEVLVAHLAGEPQANEQPQFYKAEQKPEVGPRQSFEEAVRSSGLTEEQQRSLLRII